ncbi:hypothetical protein Tco_1346597 [Tanacetum coccineum]
MDVMMVAAAVPWHREGVVTIVVAAGWRSVGDCGDEDGDGVQMMMVEVCRLLVADEGGEGFSCDGSLKGDCALDIGVGRLTSTSLKELQWFNFFLHMGLTDWQLLKVWVKVSEDKTFEKTR